MMRVFGMSLAIAILVALVVHNPATVAEPGPSPADPAKEDLRRVEYPSHRDIAWHGQFIRPSDSLETLFGDNWPVVARFNRIDRRHTYPGMTIKVPDDLQTARNYCPLPAELESARRYDKYILINMTEQWLGAYEHGRLRFSMPAATGAAGHETPVGLYRVDARHREHTSSLYKTEDGSAQYPMDYAFRFHVGADNIAYWIHSRDLPGRPASHGCVGVYNEAMQNRVYGLPADPQLNEAQRLYDWAVGEGDYGPDSGQVELLEDGPVVEVIGQNPRYLPEPLRVNLVRR